MYVGLAAAPAGFSYPRSHGASRPVLIRMPRVIGRGFSGYRRGFGQLTCPSGQQPTASYTGQTVCCGVPGTPPEADPCSYINSPQYVATQQQAASAALQPGGAGLLGTSILQSIDQYPQNVQNDAIDCVSNPGLTFTDPMGIQVTCPSAQNDDNGIPVSIYTAAQIAAMLAPTVTPAQETAANVVGTSIPISSGNTGIFSGSAPVATNQGPAISAAPSVRLVNSSGGSNSSFNVGDSWQIIVTGPPNATVSASASQNGASQGSSTMGTIGSGGQLVLSGTMSAAQAGNWTETWTVGTSPAGNISFTVNAPAGGSSGGSSPSGTGTPSGSIFGGSSTSSSDITGFLTDTFTVAGISVPYWAAGVAVLGALWLFGGKK